MKRLVQLLPKGAIGAVASRGSNALLAFVSTVVIARALGSRAYGSYSLAVTSLGLLALVTQLGLDSMTSRNLAVYVHKGDMAHARSFMFWTTRVVLVACVVVYAISFLVLTLNPMVWTSEQVDSTKIILVGLPFVSLLRLSRGRLQALDRTALGLMIELPFWNGLLLATGLLTILVPRLRTSVAMAVLHVVTFVVAWAVAHIMVLRALPKAPSKLEPVAPVWLKSSVLFTILGGLNFLLSQGGVLWAGTLLTEEETGHFSVALRTASIVLIVLQPIQQVVAPRLARAWSDGDRLGLQLIAKRSGQVSLALGACMGIAFWVLGPWLLRLFGSEYADALWALRWLTLAQLILILFGPWNIVLQMIHKEGSSALVLAIAFVIGIPLTIVLTKLYGISGTALGRVATALLAAGGGTLVLWRMGLNVSPILGAKGAEDVQNG